MREMNQPSDSLLIEQVRDGDRAALGQLLEMHQNRLFSIALRMVSNRDDAAEVTQDAMLKIIQDYLDLTPEDRMRFQVGRRFGFLLQTGDLQKAHLNQRATEICHQLGITAENVDQIIEKHVSRSI